MASAAPVMTWLGLLPGWAARARARRARAVLAVMMTGGARQAIALGKPGWGQGTAMQAVAGSRAAGGAAEPARGVRAGGGGGEAGDRAGEAGLGPGHGDAGGRGAESGGVGGEAVAADEVEPGLELVAAAGEGRPHGRGRCARGGGEDGSGCGPGHRGGDLGGVRVRLGRQQRAEPAGGGLGGDGGAGGGGGGGGRADG